MSENTQKSPVFHMLRLILIAISLFLLSFPVSAGAQDAVPGFRSTDLPIPRFVSLKSDKVYVRAGPALRYPIRWIYKQSGMPVEIIQEFDTWRKIRDVEGEDGWIHQSLLSGARTVLVYADDLVPLRDDDKVAAKMVARLEPNVIANLETCRAEWCRLEVGGYHGWVERNFLWGIYADEELN